MADPDLLAKGGRGEPDFLFITHPACFSSFCNSLFFLTQNEGDCAPQVPPLDLPLYIIEQFFPYWFFSFFFFCTLHTHARWITSFLRIFLTLLTPLQIQGGLCRRVLGSRCKFCNQNLKHWKFTSSIYFLAYLSSSVKEKKLRVFF